MLTAIMIICIVLLLLLLFSRRKRGVMSFHESMDLTELPIVTFYNNDVKLNFLLDTGSNVSQINETMIPSLDVEMVKSTNQVSGIEGIKHDVSICKMEIKYKDKPFLGEFCIHDLSQAFDIVKQESGVQLHGILGSLFFKKYRYVLDFDELIAYSRKNGLFSK